MAAAVELEKFAALVRSLVRENTEAVAAAAVVAELEYTETALQRAAPAAGPPVALYPSWTWEASQGLPAVVGGSPEHRWRDLNQRRRPPFLSNKQYNLTI